jgi:hypothetical protein
LEFVLSNEPAPVSWQVLNRHPDRRIAFRGDGPTILTSQGHILSQFAPFSPRLASAPNSE